VTIREKLERAEELLAMNVGQLSRAIVKGKIKPKELGPMAARTRLAETLIIEIQEEMTNGSDD